MRGKQNYRRGFTLVEMVVVIAVIGVLLAVVTPSFLAWYRSAESVRLNQSARTIFLSAQEAFTNARGTSLFDELNTESWEVDLDADVKPTPGTEELEKNRNNIRALRISRAGGGDPVLDKVLRPYLADAGVLENSILIEYNRTTGVVRAVFYSEQAGALGYEGAETDGANVVSRSRDDLKRKRQGYYGVDYTGELGGAMTLEAPTVRIENGERLTVEWNDVTPVPYDESVTYDLRVYQDGAQVLELPGLPNLFKLQVADVSVAEDTPTNGSILYKDPLSGRLILVLDCLHHSVSRYPGIRPGLITAEVVAKAPGAEDAAGRSNEEHSHFAGESAPGGMTLYEIKNARHLNNMRYAPSGSDFLQTSAVIDWQAAENDYRSPNDLNFVPTRFPDGEAFTGAYKTAPPDGGTHGVITGLTIDPAWEDAGKKNPAQSPRTSFVGLFAELSGADLERLILEDARVAGADHVGAFAGRATDARMEDCHLRSRGEPIYDAGGSGGSGGGDTPSDRPTPGDRWENGFAYLAGDIVKHGNTYYRCIKDLPEELRGVPPQNKKAEGYWEKIPDWQPRRAGGVSFSNVEEWQAGTIYRLGAVVTDQGRWYICADDQIPAGVVPGTPETPWFPMPAPDPDGEWPDWEERRYASGEQVIYQGHYWICVAMSGSNYHPEWAARPPQWADLGEVGQKPPDPVEPTEIPPAKPDISGGSADFSALSRVTGTGSYVGGLVGESIGGSYRTVSAGAVVYAGTGLTAEVNPHFGGAADGRLVLDYTLTGGGSYAGGLFGAMRGGALQTAVSRTLAAGGSYAGGVAGYAEGLALSGTVRSVGDVSGGADVGGLFGGCDFAPGGLVNEANVLGGQRVGGLVGSNRLTITGSENKGLVRGYPVSGGAAIGQIGGIAGLNAAGGRIEESKNSAALYNGAGVSEAPGRWEALPANALYGQAVGGIAGENAGEISGCTLAGSVFGEKQVGGIAGKNTGTVSDCDFAEFSAANGIVQGVENVGGVVGWNTGSGLISGTRNGPDRRAANLLAPGESVDVSGLLKVLASGKNAGGYVGLEGSQAHTGLENAAFVSGAGNVGGVVGYTHAGLTECVNRGLVQADGEAAGGVAGRSDQSLEGCRNEGRVSGLGGNYFGGVAGVMESGAYAGNGVNAGLVENPGKGAGANYLGGVAGYVRAGTLSDCSNEGTVGSEYTGGSYVGGVVGRMDGGRIENCFNGFEDLDPDDGGQPRLWNAGSGLGGVAGYSSPGGSTAVTVTECYNYADLTDTGDPDKTGGILGGARGDVTVENCANYGDIESKGKYVDGIAGQTENTAVRIRDCRNEGDIFGGDATGGIVGKNQATIEGCTNEGKSVEGGSYVGGIAGSHDSRKEITNCESGADVTASASAAGGIAGSSRGTVSFCTMRGGYVSAGKASNGTSNAGGLVGSSGSSVDTDGAVESCVLDPPEGGLTVKGEGNYVGGLVGTNNGSLKDNAVPAVQPVRVSGGSSVGGLVGYLQTGSLRQYENGENFTVNGTGIRVGGIAGEARVGISGEPDRPVVNTATVHSESYNVGGIVGENKENAIVIQYCENRGKVSSAERNAGGILGGTQQSSGTRILDCVNRGLVELPANGKSSQNSVGGIAGGVSKMEIVRCINEGEVRHSGNTAGNGNTGGIVGGAGATRIEECDNRGAVTAVPLGLGGIAGQATDGSVLVNCRNSAPVGAAGGPGTAGGIAGAAVGSTIETCENSGEVRADGGTVGGIVGSLRAGSRLEDSRNTAPVTGGANTGGLAGKVDNSALWQSVNTGAVVGGSQTGGLAGSADGKSTLESSDNTAAVRGDTNTGGLVGSLEGALDDCLNLGAVEGRASSSGGLAGKRTDDAVITDSFYYADPSDGIRSVGAGTVYTPADSPAENEPPADRRLTAALFEENGVPAPDFTDRTAVRAALESLPWPLAVMEEEEVPPDDPLPPEASTPEGEDAAPPADDPSGGPSEDGPSGSSSEEAAPVEPPPEEASSSPEPSSVPDDPAEGGEPPAS